MTNPKADFAVARPTKQFFVSMLTRDITLADAILDLVDNCLDGALRMANGGDVDYSKRSIQITFDGSAFSIVDDCGGIPRDIAKNYAFKMGRESGDDRDSDSETIGMYGVGMKRAIFKMGRDAVVESLSGSDGYEVRIAADWLDNPEWEKLAITDLPATQLSEPGTRVEVKKLYDGVARQFGSPAFDNELRMSIGEHFTLFLQRGLTIMVNGETVQYVPVEVLASDSEGAPAPYVFKSTIGGVDVSIAVGLNSVRAAPEEPDEDSDDSHDRSSSAAGWTVFCNERAVIFGDKSRLTGWGDGLPLYHYQYSRVTGIVEFKSKSADALPVTTTKRALDTSSDVWLQALVKMKAAMRVWITYTNWWKNHPASDHSVHWKKARPMQLAAVVAMVGKRAGAIRAGDRIEFDPNKRQVLPKPEELTASSRRVVFSRPAAEIKAVSREMFDRDNERPGIVGEACFVEVLKRVRSQEG